MRRLQVDSAKEPSAPTSADLSSNCVVRPSTPNDASEIALLLAEAGLHPNVGIEQLRWKYWEEYTDRIGPRSIVMTRGTRIVAHAGIVRGICASPRGEIRTAHLVDWAARTDAAGTGMALLKHVARAADALIAIGGSTQTLRILPLLGFSTVGRVCQFVRPLRPLSLITHAQDANWRRLPRAARGWIWTAAAPKLAEHYSVSRIELDDIDRLTPEWPTPSEGLTLFKRTVTSVRHILTCPSTPMKLYSWKGKHGLQGYFILGFAPAQIRLVDCWTNSTDAGDWHELLDAAVWVARKTPHAVEIICYASDNWLIAALEDRGFRARGSHPIQWLSRANRSNSIMGELRVQMFDNDAAYNHHGRAEFWT